MRHAVHVVTEGCQTPKGGCAMEQPASLVCISHLWWDWVWQRPQHLLSRLARHYPVFWAEEPHIEIGEAYEAFDVTEERSNLHVSRLILRSDAATFWSRLNEVLDRTGGHA